MFSHLLDCCMHLRVESNDILHKVDGRFLGLYHHTHNEYFKEDKLGQKGIGLSKRGKNNWKVIIYNTIDHNLAR